MCGSGARAGGGNPGEDFASYRAAPAAKALKAPGQSSNG
jgi:hypothetical protein